MANNLKVSLVIALLFPLSFLNVAYAMTVSKYEEIVKKDKSSTETYIKGLGNGYFWSNVILEVRGGARFYCQPKNLVLYGKNYVDILDKEIIKLRKSKEKDVEDREVELLLYQGLVSRAVNSVMQ